MISTKSLLWGLSALLSLDILLTMLMVRGMGAIELNSLATILGFPVFMALKIVASAAAVYAIYIYCIPSAPTVTRYGMVAVGAVYGAVFTSNAYQIMAAVV